MEQRLLVFLALAISAPLHAREAALANAPAASSAAAESAVARAVFTRAVVDREPQDALTSVGSDVSEVYFFTELRNLSGQPVTHRWEFKDKVMAEVKFDIGAARWRVFSKMRLDPAWLGEWKVSVLDRNGSTLGVNTFTYHAKRMAAPAAP